MVQWISSALRTSLLVIHEHLASTRIVLDAFESNEIADIDRASGISAFALVESGYYVYSVHSKLLVIGYLARVLEEC
jgi:hypothetical protein